MTLRPGGDRRVSLAPAVGISDFRAVRRAAHPPADPASTDRASGRPIDGSRGALPSPSAAPGSVDPERALRAEWATARNITQGRRLRAGGVPCIDVRGCWRSGPSSAWCSQRPPTQRTASRSILGKSREGRERNWLSTSPIPVTRRQGSRNFLSRHWMKTARLRGRAKARRRVTVLCILRTSQLRVPRPFTKVMRSMSLQGSRTVAVRRWATPRKPSRSTPNSGGGASSAVARRSNRDWILPSIADNSGRVGPDPWRSDNCTGKSVGVLTAPDPRHSYV
jgi:hypothetical protein